MFIFSVLRGEKRHRVLFTLDLLGSLLLLRLYFDFVV